MPVYIYLAANQAHLGKAEEANGAVEALRRISPAMTIGLATGYIPFKEATVLASLTEDLRKAGLPE